MMMEMGKIMDNMKKEEWFVWLEEVMQCYHRFVWVFIEGNIGVFGNTMTAQRIYAKLVKWWLMDSKQ